MKQTIVEAYCHRDRLAELLRTYIEDGTKIVCVIVTKTYRSGMQSYVIITEK